MYKHFIRIIAASIFLTACTVSKPTPLDYTGYYEASPKSILVVPVMNNTNEADAADFFLSTISIPLAERGYYVFPVNMIKRAMENDGLSDASLVFETDPRKLGELFNSDSILYVQINKWDTQYAVISSNILVGFKYTLKDAKTGLILWENKSELVYSQSGNSGNIIADLITTAITAGINSLRSDFTPLAMHANNVAIGTAGRGVPYGPYNKENSQNQKFFPQTGSGWNGTEETKPDELTQ